jgi:hypothetical protein
VGYKAIVILTEAKREEINRRNAKERGNAEKRANKGHILAFRWRVAFYLSLIHIGTYFAKKSDATSLAREDMHFYRLGNVC